LLDGGVHVFAHVGQHGRRCRAQQRVLVAEVPVDSRWRHPDLVSGCPQAERGHAVAFDQFLGRVKQRALELTVVVGP